jgi:hypothetical protein
MELKTLLAGIPFECVSPHEVGIDYQVDETGHTFEENARLKALTLAKISGLITWQMIPVWKLTRWMASLVLCPPGTLAKMQMTASGMSSYCNVWKQVPCINAPLDFVA